MSATYQMRELRDPLTTFDWKNLGAQYERLCRKFDQNSPYLNSIDPRPTSDRALYHVLLNRFSSEIRTNAGISVDTYLAMLYWKLYSQKAAILQTCHFLVTHPEEQQEAADGLRQLSKYIDRFAPTELPDVIALLRDHSRFKFRGMKDRSALPVRTTFLHFTNPRVIPIFDKQVLLAVGISEKDANHKMEYLQLYFPYALELAKRYGESFLSSDAESPLRLVDMALWVTRNNFDGRNIEC
jgi:hypothetical protein